MTAIPAAAPHRTPLVLHLLRLRTFVALILVLGFFSFAAPNFLTAANAVIVSKHVALNAFLAIGMTFVIITGGIDLSVGSIVGLCGMVAGWLVLNGVDTGLGWTIWFNTFEISLIVGLVASPERIVQIRQNRLLSLNAADDDSAYVDKSSVAEEIAQSRRIFERNNWPVIDVGRRSIEETAAAILDLYKQHRLAMIAQ